MDLIPDKPVRSEISRIDRVRRKDMRRIMVKSSMCTPPLLTVAHRAGERSIWIDSQGEIMP